MNVLAHECSHLNMAPILMALRGLCCANGLRRVREGRPGM